MSLKLTGENITIFKNDKGNYTTSISNKLLDGTWQNAPILVQFKKGTELENKTKINITNGFMSFFKGQDDKPVFKIVVLEFTQVGDAAEDTSSSFDSDSLPF